VPVHELAFGVLRSGPKPIRFVSNVVRGSHLLNNPLSCVTYRHGGKPVRVVRQFVVTSTAKKQQDEKGEYKYPKCGFSTCHIDLKLPTSSNSFFFVFKHLPCSLTSISGRHSKPIQGIAYSIIYTESIIEVKPKSRTAIACSGLSLQHINLVRSQVQSSIYANWIIFVCFQCNTISRAASAQRHRHKH